MDKAAKIDEIRKEVSRIEESARYSSQSQLEQAKLWRAVNLLLGLPAAVLAAIAAGTGLASAAGRVPAAILALIAAGFGAALTTLNASRRMNQAQSSGNAYLALETAARQLGRIDLSGMTEDEARAALGELTSRRDELNQTADIPGFYAYWRGKKNIEKGRQAYEVDK
jgi:hypothetical protein